MKSDSSTCPAIANDSTIGRNVKVVALLDDLPHGCDRHANFHVVERRIVDVAIDLTVKVDGTTNGHNVS